jgi:fructosamine-3-kinase
MSAMRPSDLETAVCRVLGVPVQRARPLAGGCVGEVWLVRLADGSSVVAKSGGVGSGLDTEGEMLGALAAPGVVPVPGVLHAEPGLLLLEHVPNDGQKSPDGEARLAELVAALHAVEADRYGFACDTLIGGLTQPNPESDSWSRFYAEHRLLDMGRRADARGALPPGAFARLERLAAAIETELDGPDRRPVLIHGDLWAGNVLWDAGLPVALIDPAVYHADPEVELAFIDLMGGMGRAFWGRYTEIRPIRDGFWERRRDIYCLYPLLVHAVLFGGGYGASVDGTLRRLGI